MRKPSIQILPPKRPIISPVVIHPDWRCPANIQACVTTRIGGVSTPPYEQLNLGDHVNDAPAHVIKNRALLSTRLNLPAEPLWLQQVHGTTVVNAANVATNISADAAFTNQNNVVCSVLTADCLPVFFCTEDGVAVAVAHAGWRGLAAGILQATVKSLNTSPEKIICWLGPAIGPKVFEVGSEVREAFVAEQSTSAAAFIQTGDNHWLADIYALARIKLGSVGVTQVSGGGECTYTDVERFYSYRRDGITGRMASLIWKV